MRKSWFALVAVAALVVLGLPGAGASDAETRPLRNQGAETDADAYSDDAVTLARDARGLTLGLTVPTPAPESYTYAEGTTPGEPEVFTLWAFVFNFPDQCSDPCDIDDVGIDTPAQGGAYGVDGVVADGATMTLAGRVAVGDPAMAPGGAMGAPLQAPLTAEVHIAIAPHGQYDPDDPSQLTTPVGSPTCACWWVSIFLPASLAETVNLRNQGTTNDINAYAQDAVTLARDAGGLTLGLTVPTPAPGTYTYADGTVPGEPEVFTLWAFVFNFPDLCSGPCDIDDVGIDTAAQGGAYGVDGVIADGPTMTLAGRIAAGDPAMAPGGAIGAPLQAPLTAEVHVAIAPHGQHDPDDPSQLTTPVGSPACGCWWVSIFWPSELAPAPALTGGLSATAGLAAWISGSPTTAASLFAALDGVEAIWVWDGVTWNLYGMAGATAIGTDSPITFGTILFIG